MEGTFLALLYEHDYESAKTATSSRLPILPKYFGYVYAALVLT